MTNKNKDNFQVVRVVSTDPLEFIKEVLDMGAKGAKLKNGAYVYLRSMPLSVELVVPKQDDGWVEESPTLSPTPVQELTREYLEGLIYNDLQTIAKEYEITARKKEDILNEFDEIIAGSEEVILVG